MNKISLNISSYIIALVFGLSIISVFNSCEKARSCPEGNICVEGNVLTYQTKATGAKLIIDAPPDAVYNNTAVVITDMVPEYPANVNYGTYNRHFAGGMFMVEPFDLDLKKLITVTIEYPGSGFIDIIGNNFEEDLELYFIDEDFNWSIVNANHLDIDANRVSAQVTRLGIYAVGAIKDCIIGEWRNGFGTLTYMFEERITFTNDGKGKREFLDICQVGDTSLAIENFSWKFEEEKLSIYDFSARIACDTLGLTTPDKLIEYDCTGPTLVLYDVPLANYNRFY